MSLNTCQLLLKWCWAFRTVSDFFSSVPN